MRGRGQKGGKEERKGRATEEDKERRVEKLRVSGKLFSSRLSHKNCKKKLVCVAHKAC